MWQKKGVLLVGLCKSAVALAGRHIYGESLAGRYIDCGVLCACGG